MNRKFRLLCIGMVLLCFSGGPANADIVTFTGNTLIQGSINGSSVVGQSAILTIDYSDALTFSGGSIDFGTNSNAVVTIGGVNYAVDPNGTSWGINVRPNYFSWADPAGLIAISPSDNDEIFTVSPNDGETLTEYLNRTGRNGSAFTPELVLGLASGMTLNNGGDNVTQTIFGTPGGSITVTASTAVPEPSTCIFVSLAAIGLVLRKRKRILAF